MKTTLLWLGLFISTFAVGQTTRLTLPNLENSFEVKLEKNDNDGVDVLITDSKNDGNAWRFTTGNNMSISTFTNNVFAKIALTENYYFKSTTAKIAFKIPKIDLLQPLTVTQFIEAVKKLEQKDFILLLKTKTIFNNDKDETTFDNFLKKLKKDSDVIEVFKDNHNFVFKRVGGKVNLYDGVKATEPKINDITKETNFYESFFKTFYENNEFIKSTLLPSDDVDAIVKTFNYNIDVNSKKLEEIYKIIDHNSEYTFISNYSIFDASKSPKKIVEVSLKNNFDDNYFMLKFCGEGYDCKITMKILNDIDRDSFKIIIENLISNDFNEKDCKMNDADITTLYNTIKKNIEEKVIEEKNKEFKTELATTAEKIENAETEYSGNLKLNKELRVYKLIKNKNGRVTGKELFDDKFFNVDYATVRFFNNKAKEIVIVGKLINKQGDDIDREFVVVNYQYSIRLRALNNTLQYVKISPLDKDAINNKKLNDKLYLNYNDVFHYYPYESSYNYSVRNKEYKIYADKTVKIEERKLMDYFTAVIFSDVLGLNNKNANALLQAEGRIKIPLWIANLKYWSLFHSLNADVNASIYNGFDENSRSIIVNSNTKLDKLTINNFDFIKFNNINVGVNMSFFNMELKGLSSELSLGYGLRYYRAGLKYTLQTDTTDVVKNYQLNALTHELSANIEIRPQINFGADLNFAYNWLNARGSTADLPVVLNTLDKNDDKRVLRFQLNLYTKLNPDKTNDGIYARLGGYYHLGVGDFYPQILVGYATNLSSFVNKFKK